MAGILTGLGTAPTPRDEASELRHVDWINRARGIAMVLVVVGHAIRGLQSNAGVDVGAAQAGLDDAIYLFHMPLFFMLSGLIFSGVKPGWSATDFIKNRATALVWPIIPWTYIYIGSRVLGGGGANKPTDWSDLILFTLPPFEIFWFLWALFLIQLIAAPLRGLGPIVLLRAGVGALFITKIVPSSCAALFVPALFSLLPFMIGVALRDARPRASIAISVAALAVFALLQTLHAADIASSRLEATVLSSMTALSASVAIATMPMSAHWPGDRILRLIGRNTMAIYLTHVIFAAMMRTALLKFGVEDQWFHLALGTLAGCACPFAVALALRKMGLEKALGMSAPSRPSPGLKPAARAAR